jgi:type I restriction enzyme S subunit
VKKDWDIKKLGDICDFQNGFAFKSHLYKQTGLPILRITNIQNQELEIDNLVYFQKKDYKENFDKYRVFKGDLVVAMSGATTGKLGISRTDTILYLNQRVGKFIPKEKILISFLYYFLSTKVEESLKIAAGAAQPNLSTEQINNFNIPLPSISEQIKIVSILEKVFSLIDTAKVNAEKNIKNARELFKSTLEKLLTNTGKDWDEKNLDEIIESNVIGLTKNSTEQNLKYDYKYVKMNNITRDNDFNLTKYTCVNATKEEVAKFSLKDGDFLFNTRNSYELVGKTCLFHGFSNEVVLYNNNIMRIRFINSINPIFINYAFTTKRIIEKLNDFKSGTTNVSAIYYKDLRNLPLQIPTLKEQEIIVKKLDTLSVEIKKLEFIYKKKLENLEELKKSILEKAFSGELDTIKSIAV